MHLRFALVVPLCIAALRSCATPPPITMTDARTLQSSVGINLHLEYPSTPYADVARTAAALRFLGITHARDAALRSGDASLSQFVGVARSGVKFDLFVSQSLGAQLERLAALARSAPEAIEIIEGPNEANHEPSAAGALGDTRAVQAYQSALYRQAHGTGALAAAPIANFTYWPPLSGRSDFANFHAYPRVGDPLSGQLAWQRRLASAVEPAGVPIICTETGFATGGVDPVSEQVQAEAETILLLENFRSGVRRTYLYELFDEHDDHAAPHPDRENHWGVFRVDGRPKPAALAIRRMMTLVSGPVGGAGAPAAERVRVNDQGFRALRVERSDGAHLTFIWRRTSRPSRTGTVNLLLPGQDRSWAIDLATGATLALPFGGGRAPIGTSPIVIVEGPHAAALVEAANR